MAAFALFPREKRHKEREERRASTDKNSKKKHVLLTMMCSLALTMCYFTSASSALDRQLSKQGIFQVFSKKQPYKQKRGYSYYNNVVVHRSKILIGIFSTSGIQKYDHRREYIRDTFVNSNEKHLCSLQEYINRVEHGRKQDKIDCEIIYTFVIGGGDSEERPPDHDDEEPLILTHDQHGNSEPDCTYLNIRENMEKGKSATWLKYASLIGYQYDIDYVMKADDDTVLTVPQLAQLSREELPPVPYNTRIYGGPPRPSRTANTLYAAGELYFMSGDLAYYVGNELTAQQRKDMRTAKRHIEDLDMGTYVYSHPYPIKFINLDRIRFWAHSHWTKEEENYRIEWNKRRIEERFPLQTGSSCISKNILQIDFIQNETITILRHY